MLNIVSVTMYFSFVNIKDNCRNHRHFHRKPQVFCPLRCGIWGVNLCRLPCKRASFQTDKNRGKQKTEKQCLSVYLNLKLKYLLLTFHFINCRLSYFTSMNFLLLSFSCSVNFGRLMFNTPFSTLAEILSLSTSSGRIIVCWNLEYENSRRR